MLVASSLSAIALVGGAATVPASAAPVHAADHAADHAAGTTQLSARCTLTSTHKCIRGGQFCPKASYGRSGWDAAGRRYVCKGSRTHPHWMKP